MYFAQQDTYTVPVSSRDCVAIRHPGRVSLRLTRAGIQEELDSIEHLLDSGSRPARRCSSGMTGSANCDKVPRGEDIFAELTAQTFRGIQGLRKEVV